MSESQSLLIRLLMHPKNNPHMIDKLIILRGLPYEWIFKKSKYRIENESGDIEEGVGDALLKPWEPDVDENIPREVRDLTQAITFLHWYPDTNIAASTGPKVFKGFWEKRTVWGLRLDYSNGQAQELWTRIEDFIERTVARGDRIPDAVQVAKDQKSEFRTYLAKRGKTLSSLELIAMDVPLIDLRAVPAPVPSPSLITVVSVPVNPDAPSIEPQKPDVNLYRCEDCNKEFLKSRALHMHRVAAHRKEKVTV